MRKFGLEVEYGGSVDAAVQELRAEGLSELTNRVNYSEFSQTYWVVKTDASVNRGGEMVSPPLDFDDPEQRGQVNKAIAALVRSGATTDPSAGIHVHIDASDLTAEQVAMVARCFTKFEDVIYRLATSGWRTMRPGGIRYCKPLTQTQIDGLAKAKTPQQVGRAYYGHDGFEMAGHGHGSRYCGINLHSWFYRGTIEFRVFNSSLNAERIQAYIAICMALVEDARRGNKRQVGTRAYRLGGMKAGTTDPKAAYHRFQQVVRYSAGMNLEDYKLMNRCWKDSVPQDSMVAMGGW